MDSGYIIVILAGFTICIVLALAVFHFGYFLKDPRNRQAAANALVNDGSSATTEVRDGKPIRPSFMRPEQTMLRDEADPVRTTAEGHAMTPPTEV